MFFLSTDCAEKLEIFQAYVLDTDLLLISNPKREVFIHYCVWRIFTVPVKVGENDRFSASDHITHQGGSCKQRPPGSHSNAPRYPAVKSFCSGSKCLFLFLIFSYASLLLIAFAGLQFLPSTHMQTETLFPTLPDHSFILQLFMKHLCANIAFGTVKTAGSVFPSLIKMSLLLRISQLLDLTLTWSYINLTLHHSCFLFMVFLQVAGQTLLYLWPCTSY